jgi:hypothetical protein
MLKTLPQKRRQKGFVSVYVFVSSFFVLIPVGGLAVDLGVLYNVQAKLQAAVDAAAIGAGNQLHASTNLSSQGAAISNAAQLFFNANFPTGYFGTGTPGFGAIPANGSNGTKTITVNAQVQVPMLLLRVLGISASEVGAYAVSSVRYINMMVVVDRSGSISAENAEGEITNDLNAFIGVPPGTAYLTSGVDTVGMISFGASVNADYPSNTNFCTSSGSCAISNAINNIYWGNNGTNTAEGLYQAWTQLYAANLPGALPVIVLLTDGRPSAFTANFKIDPSSPCSSKVAGVTIKGASNAGINGVIQSYVGLGWPPPTSGNDVFGLLNAQEQNNNQDEVNWAAPNTAGCSATPDSTSANGWNESQGANTEVNVNNDINAGAGIGSFPLSAGPVNNVGGTNTSYTSQGGGTGTGVSTQKTATCGYYATIDTSSNDPQSVRYSAFNVADCMAYMIHHDTTLQPIIFGAGINYNNSNTEPIDPDYIARLANDPNYLAVGTDPGVTPAGQHVYTSGTMGYYCNSYANAQQSQKSLAMCFQEFSAQLLRLAK